MSRKNKNLSRIEALVMPSTQVAQSAPRETLRSFTREYDAQQAAEQKAREDAALAPVRQAEAQLTESLRALRAQHAAALLAGTSDDLLSRCTQITDEDVIENGAPISIEVVRVRITNALDTIVLKLEDEGIRITDDGRTKLRRIAQQARYRSINWMDASNWQALFTYADDLNALNDRDVSRTRIAPQAVEAPVASESFDDVLNRESTFSRSGAKKIAQAAMASMQSEAAAAFELFRASIEREFHYVFSQSEIDALIAVMRNRNLTFCSLRDWSQARRACINFGSLPETLRTPSEILDDLIEITPNTYEGRQELKRQERLLKVPITQVEY